MRKVIRLLIVITFVCRVIADLSRLGLVFKDFQLLLIIHFFNFVHFSLVFQLFLLYLDHCGIILGAGNFLVAG